MENDKLRKMSKKRLEKLRSGDFDEGYLYNVCQQNILTPEFLREFKDVLNWTNVSFYQKLSIETMEEFADYLHWSYIGCHQVLTEEFMDKYFEKLVSSLDYIVNGVKVHNEIRDIFCYQKMSEDFIRRHVHQLIESDWSQISTSVPNLSESFLWEFEDKINWNSRVWYHTLSEETLRLAISKGYIHSNKSTNDGWRGLSGKQYLSIEFCRDFKDKIDWAQFTHCKHKFLSEEFIREFQDYIKWDRMCNNGENYDQFSLEFIDEFKHKLDWYYIGISPQVTEDFLIANLHMLEWSGISSKANISREFVIQFADKLIPRHLKENPHVAKYWDDDLQVMFNLMGKTG